MDYGAKTVDYGAKTVRVIHCGYIPAKQQPKRTPFTGQKRGKNGGVFIWLHQVHKLFTWTFHHFHLKGIDLVKHITIDEILETQVVATYEFVIPSWYCHAYYYRWNFKGTSSNNLWNCQSILILSRVLLILLLLIELENEWTEIRCKNGGLWYKNGEGDTLWLHSIQTTA